MSFSLSPAPVCHTTTASTPGNSPRRLQRLGSCTPSSSSTSSVVPFPCSMVADGLHKSQSPRLIGLYRSPSSQIDSCTPGPSTFKVMASPSASPAKEARARKQAREAASAAKLVRGGSSRLGKESTHAAWTRSRGSSNQHRHDSSGSDDIDDDMQEPPRDRFDLSPAAPAEAEDAQRQARIDAASRDAVQAHRRLSQLSNGGSGGSSIVGPRSHNNKHNTPGPSSNAYGLERHFATYISMTPPASFGSRTSNETPFACTGQQPALAPATELRPPTAGIPRSQAFGRLAPLSKLAASTQGFAGDRGMQGLGISSAGELEEWEPNDIVSEEEEEQDEPEDDGEDEDVAAVVAQRLGPSVVPASAARARSRTELDNLVGSSAASRRGKVTAFLRHKETAADEDGVGMDVDSENEGDGHPPPSPSPLGDATFGAQIASGTSMDEEGPLLQPGLLRPPAIHPAKQQRDSADDKPRRISATANGQAPEQVVSMTPDRYRAAGPGRAGQRNRALSSAAVPRAVPESLTPRSTSSSALAAGEDKLAGAATLFSFASQPRPSARSAQAESRTPESSRDAKRRSTGVPLAPMSAGKLFQSEIAASRSFDELPDLLSTPSSSSRPARLSTPGSSSFADGRKSGYYDTSIDSPSRLFDVGTLGADDSGVAFGDEDRQATPLKRSSGLLANSLGLRKAAGGTPGRFTHSRKSLSADSLTSPHKASFHGKTPGSRPLAAAAAVSTFHAFGPKERSALVNETYWSDASSSASTPDDRGAIGISVRARKPFTSPARGRVSGTSAPDHIEGSISSTYMTPQNFKSVKPLQAAFMSTGLVSKRNRPRENSEGSNGNGGGGGSDNLPAPPRPNFGSALGLREVVAAANAAAAANADRLNHAMPDTPVKKGAAGVIPFPVVGGSSSLRPPPASQAMMRRAPSPLGMHSPAADSISSGCSADSPLMPDACDSPTFNLMALSPPNAEGDAATAATAARRGQHGWPAFSTVPRARRPPLSRSQAFHPQMTADANEEEANSAEEAPASPSLQQRGAGHRLPQAVPTASLRRSRARATPLSHSLGRKTSRSTVGFDEGATASPMKASASQFDSPAKPAHNIDVSARLRHKRSQFSEVEHAARYKAPYVRNRNSIGLQRKNSSGLGELSPGDDAVPMTPTRTAANLKWFEAAQVLTTPSPSSRRQAAQQLRAQRRNLLLSGRRISQLSESFAAAQQKGPAAKAEQQQRSFGHLDGDVLGTPSGTSASLLGIDVCVGSRLETCFTVESVIGQGEFSEVVKAEDKATGTAYAVKRMKKAYSGPRDRLRRLEEVDVLRHLSKNRGHPNVIGLIDAWEEGGHLFVLTELCSLGTLAFFLDQYGHSVGALDEPRVWKILSELSLGLAHIHGSGILHLDLKPANVFITELGTLKIGDFGMATRWPPPNAATVLGGAALEATDDASTPGKLDGIATAASAAPPTRRTNVTGRWSLEREGDREYLAPEIMRSGQYGKAADIFSLGLILLEAAGNVQLPDNGEPWQKLRNDDFSDVDLGSLSGTLLRMLSSLLASDPTRRPTIEEIFDHPVMAVVRARMARGLLASELDQLPELNLPHSDSGLTPSASSSSVCSTVSNRTAGRSGGSEDDASDGAMRHIGPSASVSASALGLSGIPASASDRTTTSTSSSLSSNLALNVRGALIQEDEDDFVREVVQADPLEHTLSRSVDSSSNGRYHHSGGDGGPTTMAYPMYGSSLSSNASSASCVSSTPQMSGQVRRPFAEIQPRYSPDLDEHAFPSSYKADALGAKHDQHQWVDAMDLDDDD